MLMAAAQYKHIWCINSNSGKYSNEIIEIFSVIKNYLFFFLVNFIAPAIKLRTQNGKEEQHTSKYETIVIFKLQVI